MRILCCENFEYVNEKKTDLLVNSSNFEFYYVILIINLAKIVNKNTHFTLTDKLAQNLIILLLDFSTVSDVKMNHFPKICKLYLRMKNLVKVNCKQ